MIWGYESCENFLEDFEQFWLLDFSISSLVDGLDELVDLCLRDLSSGIHVFEGSIDEVSDFTGVQTVAFVSVVGSEYCVDGFSKFLV